MGFINKVATTRKGSYVEGGIKQKDLGKRVVREPQKDLRRQL